MSDTTTEATTRRARALTATLIEALGALIAEAQADQSAEGASASLVRLLERWRAQLATLSPAAVEPAPLVVGLTAVFALCDVRLVATGQDRGVHIDGQAVAAFDATLRLLHFQDRLRGTTVGEAAMVALLGGFIDELPPSAPPGGGLH